MRLVRTRKRALLVSPRLTSVWPKNNCCRYPHHDCLLLLGFYNFPALTLLENRFLEAVLISLIGHYWTTSTSENVLACLVFKFRQWNRNNFVFNWQLADQSVFFVSQKREFKETLQSSYLLPLSSPSSFSSFIAINYSFPLARRIWGKWTTACSQWKLDSIYPTLLKNCFYWSLIAPFNIIQNRVHKRV